MRVYVEQGIENVDQGMWDTLTEGHPFAGWEWCYYGEVVMGEGQGYYVLVYHEEEVIGGARIFPRYEEYIPSESAIIRKTAAELLKRRPLLVCRTPLSTFHKGIFLPDDPPKRDEVLGHIRGALHDVAKEKRASFIVCDYIKADELAYDWGDFICMEDFMNIGTRLSIGWETYEEYLYDMKRKRRKNILYNTRQAEDKGVEIRFHDEVTDADRALALIETIKDKYDTGANPFARMMLEHHAAIPSYTWMTAHHEGRMVGCEMMLYDERTGVCIPTLYGRDQSVDYVYFLMYYEEIRYAIEELKATTIIGDSEVYNFKYRLGFVEDPRNNLAFRAMSSPLQKMAEQFIPMVQ